MDSNKLLKLALALLLLCCVTLVCLLSACGKDGGESTPDKSPVVTVTNSPEGGSLPEGNGTDTPKVSDKLPSGEGTAKPADSPDPNESTPEQEPENSPAATPVVIRPSTYGNLATN